MASDDEDKGVKSDNSGASSSDPPTLPPFSNAGPKPSTIHGMPLDDPFAGVGDLFDGPPPEPSYVGRAPKAPPSLPPLSGRKKSIKPPTTGPLPVIAPVGENNSQRGSSESSESGAVPKPVVAEKPKPMPKASSLAAKIRAAKQRKAAAAEGKPPLPKLEPVAKATKKPSGKPPLPPSSKSKPPAPPKPDADADADEVREDEVTQVKARSSQAAAVVKAKADEPKPDEAKPDEAKPDTTTPDAPKSDDAKLDDAKTEAPAAKSDDAKLDDAKTEAPAAKPDDTKLDDAKTEAPAAKSDTPEPDAPKPDAPKPDA